jgi:diguanylate cyclase (GGDEF)-like protein
MDPLTRLPTHLDLPGALAELRGGGSIASLSAIVFDIDGFIWVNDQYGHLEGDALLVRVAHWLESRCGQHQGRSFRVAGEEFLVLLPNRSLEEAASLARDVLSDFEGLRIPYWRRDDRRDILNLNAAVFTAWPGFENEIGRLRDEWAEAIYDAKRAQGRTYSVVAVMAPASRS